MATSNESSNTVTTTRFGTPRKELHCIDKPSGFVSGMAKDNYGYQMAYSVALLEKQFADEDLYYVLQLNTPVDQDYRDPSSWRLYANGTEVAGGSGDFAQACFYASENSFLEQCREAVLSSGVPSVEASEYRLLKMSQKIARYEPFEDDPYALGATPGRLNISL